MSHFALRKDKECLNCGTEVQGRYCHVCGQENIEPKETVWHLVTHFVYDITHFDGKFFSTVKYLLFKPGYLSKEYLKGRRASYLNPIKMYVFISAFFFLFFFSVVNPFKNNKRPSNNFKTIVQNPTPDSASLNQSGKDTIINVNDRMVSSLKDTLTENISDSGRKFTTRFDYGQNYNSISEYDSIQKTLPKEKRDNWLRKKLVIKSIQIKDEYGDDTTSLMKSILDRFFHSFPQIFFLSLPFFALILSILYFNRKKYFYVDHVIFSIHLYCAMFILMFLLIATAKLENLPLMGWIDYFQWGLIIYIIWYWYKALRNFYQQGGGKTFLKLFLLLVLDSILMTFISILFFFIALFTL